MQVSSSVQSANAKPTANGNRVRNDYYAPQWGAQRALDQNDPTPQFKPDINNFDKMQQKREQQANQEIQQTLRDKLNRLNAQKTELQGLQGNPFKGELSSLLGQIGSVESQLATVGSGGNIGGMVGLNVQG